MVAAFALLSRTSRFAGFWVLQIALLAATASATALPSSPSAAATTTFATTAPALALASSPSAAFAGSPSAAPVAPISPAAPTACPAGLPAVEIGGTAAARPPADDEMAAPGEPPAREATTAVASRRPGADDDAEFGIEYQLSRQAAASWLDRIGSWFKGVVNEAMAWLGTPYRRGGASRHGIDCSGLTGAVFARRGIDLPRTAAEQFALGRPVGSGELQPGDLVFFRNTYKRGISHVGIFVGDGRFIHAAGRRQGVIVSVLARPYYQLRFAGARRVATPPGESLASLAGNDTGAGTRAAEAAPPAPATSAAPAAPTRLAAGDR